MAAPKGTRPPNAGKGRKAGVPNKATADARKAIAMFVDRNAPRLQGWLDAIADGVEGPPEVDETTGEKTKTYLIEPDPQKAFELFQSVIEYHVPKLARSEHVDGEGKALPVVQVTFVKK